MWARGEGTCRRSWIPAELEVAWLLVGWLGEGKGRYHRTVVVVVDKDVTELRTCVAVEIFFSVIQCLLLHHEIVPLRVCT